MNRKIKFMLYGVLVSLPSLCPAIEVEKVDGSQWYKDQSPERSIDGKLETSYVGIGERSYLVYRFKKSEKLSRIMVIFNPKSWHRPEKCRISIQLQDSSWQTVKQFSKMPKTSELIDLQVPVIVKAVKLEAEVMSQSKNFCIMEIKFNDKIYTNTLDANMPRPYLYHKKELHSQLFVPLKKFSHHGEGILFYSTPGSVNGRIEAVMAVTPLSADEKWFIDQVGVSYHNNIGQLPVDRDLMKYTLRGRSGTHTLVLHNNKEKVLVEQTYEPVNSRYSKNVIANGLVLRFPYYMWKKAKWQIGKYHGNFIPSERPRGFTSIKNSKFIDFDKTSGSNLKLTFSLPNGTIELIPKNFSLVKAVILNKSGIFGTFTDVCLVPDKGICKKNGEQQAFKCQWDIMFKGNFVRSVKQAYGLSEKQVKKLADTDSTVFNPDAMIKAYSGKKIDVSRQIMDKKSQFYGANFVIKSGMDTEVPLATRDLAVQLAVKAAATKDPEALERASAALDYLTSSISSVSQYGDIRVGEWELKPFMWDVSPYILAIEAMRLTGVSREKLVYWRSGAHQLYIGGKNEMLEKVKFRTDIGANVATYAVQIADLSKYFRDDSGMLDAARAIAYAMTPDVADDGIKKDYSYRHGNLFDIGYYNWLVQLIGRWSDKYNDTKWAFKGDDLNNYNQINNVMLWMFDNGMLNTMTSHGKSRLSHIKLGFSSYYKDWFSRPALHLENVRKNGNFKEVEKFVDDSPELPLGFRYFNNAGMLVERSRQIYLSLWWNTHVRVRDILKSGVNPNYNTKTPFGAYFLRARNRFREVTIPSDNYQYSGAILVDGMQDMEDWAHRFDNNKGSKAYMPIYFDGGAVLCAEVNLRARKAPDKVVKYYLTVIVTEDGLVRCMTAPAQNASPKVYEYPLALRQYLSSPVDLKSIKVADKYKTFTLCWEKLAGQVDYRWKLSDKLLDGNQIYSFIAPARIRILEGCLDLSRALRTAWEVRPLETAKITSRLKLFESKHVITIASKTIIVVDYKLKHVEINGKNNKLVNIL